MKKQNKNQEGQVIIIAIVFIAIILTLSATMTGYITQYVRSERVVVSDTQALRLAEAGLDKAIYQLNLNSSYTGESNTALGNGVFTISVATVGSAKRITSTAYIPDSTNPTSTRTVKATANINSSIVSFRFGVQVGNGGVTMANNPTINGNLFSNGNVTATSGSVTGDLTVAGGTQPTADQSWTTQNTDFNLGDIAARADVAQSFKPSVSNTLNKVSLYLKKTGAPSDITIKLVSDNAGKPSKTVLSTGTIPASTVTGTYGYEEASFSTSASLTANTTYWIIAIATVNATNYFTWGMDNADIYTGGTGKYSTNWNASTPVWTAAGGDLDFNTYMGGVNTSMTGVTVGGNAWAHSLSNCTVGGNATYQSISSCTVSGTQNPGSSDASPAAMPISDAQIADWESIAAAGGVIPGPYTISNTQVLGPKEIDGNLSISGTISLSGPVWVKGNITFSNGATLKVDPSTGTSSAVLIADVPGSEPTMGIISLSNNIQIMGNGNTNTFPMLLSTNSSTTTNAIAMNNNSNGVILYASRGTISMDNSASANEVTAYKLKLNNNVVVNYTNGLQNDSFSNGPGGSWGIVPGTYVIVK